MSREGPLHTKGLGGGLRSVVVSLVDPVRPTYGPPPGVTGVCPTREEEILTTMMTRRPTEGGRALTSVSFHGANFSLDGPEQTKVKRRGFSAHESILDP